MARMFSTALCVSLQQEEEAKASTNHLLYHLAESFHKHHLEIDLTQACVGELNTMLRGEINCPIIYGVGVNIKTGEIFPASFPDRGPDRQLRDARIFMGAQTVSRRGRKKSVE